jgi:hypothetical protein
MLVCGHRGCLRSILATLDVPKRRPGMISTQTLQACSVICEGPDSRRVRPTYCMRQGHPAHGYVH